MNPTELVELLTTGECAKLLRVSRWTLLCYRKKGQLVAVKLPGGRGVRYDPRDVARFLERRKAKS